MSLLRDEVLEWAWGQMPLHTSVDQTRMEIAREFDCRPPSKPYFRMAFKKKFGIPPSVRVGKPGTSTLVEMPGRGERLQWIKHPSKSRSQQREEDLASLAEDLPGLIVPRERIPSPRKAPRRCDAFSVYPLGDPHIGMYAWAEEAGFDFDTGIASRYIVSAFQSLVTQGTPTMEAVIINLGDFFHSDDSSNRTARSQNSLDVDTRWARVLRVGLATFITAIEILLEHHDKVHVICEIGNHDDHSAVVLAMMVAIWYREHTERVTVDCSPAHQHWFQRGKVLIMSSHGHELNAKDVESFMAATKPREWGETIYRYGYLGHFHTKMVFEGRGVEVEHWRNLAPNDGWHAAQGYKSRKDMAKIVMDHEYGEAERYTVDARRLAARDVRDGKEKGWVPREGRWPWDDLDKGGA